jgi:predicted nucleic acid-binding protein
LAACNGHGQTLETFLRTKRLGTLLSATQNASKPYNAKLFGVIGKPHLQAKFAASVGTDTAFNHKVSSDLVVDGKPYLIEVAFGYAKAQPEERQIITCVNWSVVLENQFPDLGEYLEELEAGDDQPITIFVHVAAPGAAYSNFGKSKVVLPKQVQEALFAAVKDVLKGWTKQRNAENKRWSARLNRDAKMLKTDRKVDQIEATEKLMLDAYNKASDNGELWTDARQIYYAIRDGVVQLCKIDELNSDYFTQTLLQGFIRAHPEATRSWLVAYSDRGHLKEPYTKREIGLGTVAVFDYIGGYHEPKLIEAGFRDARVLTHGPAGCYGGILFIEKEGFNPLFEQVKLAERYGLVIMSAKGMSVTAARQVVDQTCVKYGIPLLILHDFDINGFTIAGTISNTTDRYTFDTQPVTHTIGLRLADVEHYNLASESFVLKKNTDLNKVKETMRRHGATEEEIEFIVGGSKRVELNALTSRQMIDMIERKLNALGVKRVVPKAADLTEAWSLFERGERVRKVVEAAIKGMGDETPPPPRPRAS